MTDTITIYRIDNPPIELDPKDIIFTDRSRIEDGLCPRKRFLRYEYGGFGYITPGSNEDLVIGGATHEGLDLLLQGGSLEKSLEVADDYFWGEINYSDYILPEQQEALGMDGSHLVKAFIYGFYSKWLPQLLDEYEVIDIEDEINWEVGRAGDGKYIVMMSRPDGVLRHKGTGKLWHVSHKTAQDFPELQLLKFKVDQQRMSECMAVWAKYGEPVEGTLYNYFLKGRRSRDKELSIDRFSSGLIHPYMLRQSTGGDIDPEMINFQYEWLELDGHIEKTKRVPRGWEKVSIYEEMDFNLYLEWLENKLVPRCRDYLKESIIGLKEEPFNEEFAERWQRGTSYLEEQWAKKIPWTRVESFTDDYYDYEFPLTSSECFSYNRRCGYFPICWEDSQIETLIEDGSLIERVPNHLVELRKITS